jgi:hypothetical protein
MSGSILGGIIFSLLFISLIFFVVRKCKHIRKRCKVDAAPEMAGHAIIVSNNDKNNNDIKIVINS